MLKPDSADTSIVPGVPVYSDDTLPWVFYTLPNEPRYRLDDKGHPVFRFIKYRFPINRPDGKKGGGLLMFDCEFVLSDDVQKKIVDKKQGDVNELFSARGISPAPAVELRLPVWTKGDASLNLMDSGNVFVEGHQNPAHPSLYGKNITPFMIEFSDVGATLFWGLLQDQGGGMQVSYDLTAAVGCPIDAWAYFHIDKFYDFKQSVRTDDPWVGDSSQTNTITEQFRNSGAEVIDATFPAGTDPKLQAQVMDHLYKFMESMIQGETPGDIAPVPDDQRGTSGFDSIDRHFTVDKTADFSYNFHENQAIDWSFNPQGTLPNITTIPGVKWQDYAQEVDLNDAFFQQVHVTIRVNADFANLPLNSVDINLDYGKNTGNGYHFQSANDVGKFDAYMTDNNNSRKYQYTYTVNYTDESNTYTSPATEVDDEVLTIDVGELGILDINVQAGALNFDQVTQAQVTVHYEDAANNVSPIEQVLVLDKDHRQVRYQKAIFAPRNTPYRYKVLYVMANTVQYGTDWQDHMAPQLFINGPFSNTETFSVRELGSFDLEIDTVFLDLAYNDAANNYSQNKSIALNKSNPFLDWTFPVINLNGGQVTYSGATKYKDGTSQDIPQATTKLRTIYLGAVADVIQFEVVPDLIDWTQIKLAKVTIHYQDTPNGIDKSYEVIVRKDQKLQPIIQDLKDKTQKTFTYTVVFYTVGTPTRELTLGPVTTTDPTIVLDPSQVPAATH